MAAVTKHGLLKELVTSTTGDARRTDEGLRQLTVRDYPVVDLAGSDPVWRRLMVPDGLDKLRRAIARRDRSDITIAATEAAAEGSGDRVLERWSAALDAGSVDVAAAIACAAVSLIGLAPDAVLDLLHRTLAVLHLGERECTDPLAQALLQALSISERGRDERARRMIRDHRSILSSTPSWRHLSALL